MPSYTPEQIEQAKEWLKDAVIWGWPMAQVILAALEAAEKERDGLLEAAKTDLTERRIVTDGLRIDRNAWKSYAAKLEKAGDGLADYHRPLNTVPRWQDSLNDWDAARKEKL